MHSVFLSATLMFAAGYGAHGGYSYHGGAMIGPAPMPARAVVSSSGQLTLRQTGHAYSVKEKAPHMEDGKTVYFEIATSFAETTQIVLPAKNVQGFDADGKKIEAGRLAQLLKQETPVLVCGGVESVDPYYLKLLKEGTVILVLPQGVDAGHGHGPAIVAPAPAVPIRTNGPKPAPVPMPQPEKIPPKFTYSAPPGFAMVSAIDKARGELELVETLSKLVPGTETKQVVIDGKVKEVSVTFYKPVYEQVMRKLALDQGQVFDGAGTKLSVEEAWKRLAVGTTVLVSADGKPVDSAYLGRVKADTVILVPPLQGAPPPAVPAPAPAPKPKEPH